MKSIFAFIDVFFVKSTEVARGTLNAVADVATAASEVTESTVRDAVIDNAVERNAQIQRLSKLEFIEDDLDTLVHKARNR